VCDLETSRMGAPYIYDVSRLRVNIIQNTCIHCLTKCQIYNITASSIYSLYSKYEQTAFQLY